jgi:mannose-6-phosphate isomerase-like protein (cupin superfamily)
MLQAGDWEKPAMTTRLDPAASAAPTGPFATLLTAEDITALDRRQVRPGVTTATLWSHGSSHAGVMWLASGTQLGAHTHRRHAHHVWVVEGTVACLDRDLGPGSYAHVPPGVEHDMVTRPSAGAAFFYLYVDTWQEPPVVPA